MGGLGVVFIFVKAFRHQDWMSQKRVNPTPWKHRAKVNSSLTFQRVFFLRSNDCNVICCIGIRCYVYRLQLSQRTASDRERKHRCRIFCVFDGGGEIGSKRALSGDLNQDMALSWMLEGHSHKLSEVTGLKVTYRRYDRDTNPANSREKATWIMKEA